jgi:hypothetical protein
VPVSIRICTGFGEYGIVGLLYVYCTDSYLEYNYCSVVHYCIAKQKGRETVVQTSAAIIYAETDLSRRKKCTADRAEYSEIVIMKTKA